MQFAVARAHHEIVQLLLHAEDHYTSEKKRKEIYEKKVKEKRREEKRREEKSCSYYN